MKKINNDIKSRDQINEAVDQSAAELDEKITDLDQAQQEVQTVRDTLSQLEFNGTSEGSDAVKESMTSAEGVTVEVFDNADQELEETQSENTEFEQDLRNHSESDQTDIEKLSEASSQIDTTETINELVQAKEAALRDIDFLMAQIERAKTARDKSEAAQQEYQNHVRRQGGHHHE